MESPNTPAAPPVRQTLTVADISARVRERWVLALIPVLVGGTAAAAYTFTAAPVYIARTTVLVQPLLDDQYGGANLNNVLSMPTEQQMATSSAVIDKVSTKLNLTAEQVRRAIEVGNPQDTQLLTISFAASDAPGAALGAQSVAEAYLGNRENIAATDADRRLTALNAEIERVDGLIGTDKVRDAAYGEELRGLLADQRQLTSIKATSGGRVVTPSVAPSAPSAPRHVVNLIAGLVAGAIAGLVLAVLWPGRRQPVPASEITRIVTAGRRRGRGGSASPSAAGLTREVTQRMPSNDREPMREQHQAGDQQTSPRAAMAQAKDATDGHGTGREEHGMFMPTQPSRQSREEPTSPQLSFDDTSALRAPATVASAAPSMYRDEPTPEPASRPEWDAAPQAPGAGIRSLPATPVPPISYSVEPNEYDPGWFGDNPLASPDPSRDQHLIERAAAASDSAMNPLAQTAMPYADMPKDASNPAPAPAPVLGESGGPAAPLTLLPAKRPPSSRLRSGPKAWFESER